jgi:hypothetical protein
MKFRASGTLKPLRSFRTRAALKAHLAAEFALWPDLDGLDLDKLRTEPLGVFGRRRPPGWDGPVHIVLLDGYGVVGFTDRPL